MTAVKPTPALGAAAKGKGTKSPSSTNGTSTPVCTITSDTSEVTPTGSGKPDKAVYDAEQEDVKTAIDALQAKLSAVKEKIALANKSGPGNDRRTALRTELDGIRGQQSGNKTSRSKIFDQLKLIQDNIQKKVKDLQAAKSKTPFKTVAEVDGHIKNLDKQIESGNMKLADEKRALQEMSQCKRNRRIVEGFQADQESIEADRTAADALRKQLDDPASKAIAERYDAIKAELDELKKESDEAYAGRNKLFEERDGYQDALSTLYNRKRESAQRFRDAMDRYWNKVNEDKAKRAEKARAQRAAEEAQKKQEIAERIREEAAAPAFQAQIEDCQTLVDYFLGKNSGNITFASAPLSAKADVAGVPKLELRKVEVGLEEGLVPRKKKGDDDVSYFVGKGKGKGKKGVTKPIASPDANAPPATTSTPLNVPLPTLSALLSLSIPPPASSTDVSRVVEDLKTKKAWFEANQSRVTAENIFKAENEIRRLTNAGRANAKTGTFAPVSNGGSEQLERTEADGLPSTAVPSSDIPEQEIVQEGVEVVEVS